MFMAALQRSSVGVYNRGVLLLDYLNECFLTEKNHQKESMDINHNISLALPGSGCVGVSLCVKEEHQEEGWEV